MTRSLFFRAVALSVVIILAAASMNVYAETPAGRAFLRGGTAISDALNDRVVTTSLVSESLVPPPSPAAMPASPQEGKSRRVMLWVGIGITGAIAAYLIQRSVRNHGKIFGDAQ